MWSKALPQLGHCDFGGEGDLLGLAVHPNKQGIVYVGHSGRFGTATSIIDATDPRRPRVVDQIPKTQGTHSPKVVVVGDIMFANCERDIVWDGPPFVEPVAGAPDWTAGLRIYDVADPKSPKEIGFFETRGRGVHRMTCTESGFAYLSASDDGYTEQFLRIVDVNDPVHPEEVGRWWYPGMWEAGGERRIFPSDRRYAIHHGLPNDDESLLACGWWDAGFVLLDIQNRAQPQLVSNLNWGSRESGATHTALPVPGRDLVAVTDEAILHNMADGSKLVRLLDISEPFSPQVVSTLPPPMGDFVSREGRFGPHNILEPRPGTRIDANYLFVTFFNAGLRIFDIADAGSPHEVAHFLPQPYPPMLQADDVTVDTRGVVYITDRAGNGLYLSAIDNL